MSEAGSARVAVVTGAARGIGAATAIRLAQDGFAVAVLDLDEAQAKGTVEAIEAAGGKALAVGADVSDVEQVNAAVERIAAELGGPTVLVNNAGVTRDNMLFKMSESDWDTVMNVHLRGAFLMTRAVQKYMTEAKFGRIVSLSSVSALGNRGQANYSTAKAGLQGLTKTLAIELGPHGVRANAICPGSVDGDRMLRVIAREADARGAPAADVEREYLEGQSIARFVQPGEIADLCLFLASDAARMISGQAIAVDGHTETFHIG